MRKRFLVLLLAGTLSLTMPFSAMAAKSQSGGGGSSGKSSSSSSSSSSGSGKHRGDGNGGGGSSSGASSSAASATSSASASVGSGTPAASLQGAAPGQALNENAVSIQVQGADGNTTSLSAKAVSSTLNAAMGYLFANAGQNGTDSLRILDVIVTNSYFGQALKEQLAALAASKGAAAKVRDSGMVKPRTTTMDSFGNVISNLGIYRGNAAGKIFLLTAFDADGRIERVPGFIINGNLIGFFVGVPQGVIVTEAY